MFLRSCILILLVHTANCAAISVAMPTEKLTHSEQENLETYVRTNFPSDIDELIAFSYEDGKNGKLYFANFVGKSFRGWSSLCKVVRFSLTGMVDNSKQLVWRKDPNFESYIEAWVSTDPNCSLQRKRATLSEGTIDTLAFQLIQDAEKVLELARAFQHKHLRLPDISPNAELPLTGISTDMHKGEVIVELTFKKDRESTIIVLARVLNDHYEIVDFRQIVT